MVNVFIIGSKGIPAKYGGFETFVENLTARRVSKNIKYHVACMANDEREFEYNSTHCFNIDVPNIGAAKAVYYDLAAFTYCLNYIKRMGIKNPIVYVLACRIGPFISYYKRKLDKINGELYINPDGHEWLRAKWNFCIKNYWRLSEKLMVKHANLVICDSLNIENYIKQKYTKFCPQTIFIAYGSDIKKSVLVDNNLELENWYNENKISANEYFLVVGRFVPENNYETLINEFMASNSSRFLVIVTNLDQQKFYNHLATHTRFASDKRIKFVGTVYDKELLKKIRENAYAYLHGHEVGGTNPSLLEALGSTNLNLLLDVSFNHEVAQETGFYWTKEKGCLAALINQVEQLSFEQIIKTGQSAKMRIDRYYNWEQIVKRYEKTFLVKGETIL